MPSVNNESTASDLTKEPSKHTEIDDSNGLCPLCVKAGDYIAFRHFRNVPGWQVCCCEKHNCYWKCNHYWYAPSEKDKEEWGRNTARLWSMTEVEPRYLPETERKREEHECRCQDARSMFSILDGESEDLVFRLLCHLSGSDITEEGLRNSYLESLDLR